MSNSQTSHTSGDSLSATQANGGKPRASQKSGKRVCMLAYTFYESDNRVLRYAKALSERGDQVDVICLRTDEKQPAFEVLDQVNVYRIQDRQRNEKSKYSYLYRLLKFSVKSSLTLARLQCKHGYDLIHVHNVPDFLVFSAWFPKLAGAKIILDVHDILPEFFANKFRRSESSMPVRMLRGVEWASAHMANHVIISNHLWYDKITSRSVPKERCSVFINHVDPDIFSCPRTRNDKKFVMLYHGGLQRHQGLDIAIRAFAKVADQMPGAEFQIYGGGNMKTEWEGLVRQLHLEDRVFLRESLSMRKIAEIVANADLGVVAKRADSFGNEAYSTKIMEYMAAGTPVLVSKTKIDSFYFNDSIVRFFESGNEGELAEGMLCLFKDRQIGAQLARNASEYVAQNNWNVKKHEYLRLVDSLVEPASPQRVVAGRSSAAYR